MHSIKSEETLRERERDWKKKKKKKREEINVKKRFIESICGHDMLANTCLQTKQPIV